MSVIMYKFLSMSARIDRVGELLAKAVYLTVQKECKENIYEEETYIENRRKESYY